MVFHTTNLFKSIQCPQDSDCKLTNCIFSHDEGINAPKPPSQAPTAVSDTDTSQTTGHVEPANKRRRVIYDRIESKPLSRADIIRAQLAQVRKQPATDLNEDSPLTLHSSSSKSETNGSEFAIKRTSVTRPTGLTRPISPPVNASISQGTVTKDARHGKSSSPQKPKSELKKESLNPRMVPGEPVPYGKRAVLLKHLYQEMSRLNDQILTSSIVKKEVLHLTEQELIKLSLDEEEKVAREAPSVYINVMKNRVVACKKMEIEAWSDKVKQSFSGKFDRQGSTATTLLDSGLPPEHEVLLLPRLVADQYALAQFGYVPLPPTTEEAAEAARAVEASDNYETCDRCTSRFQVFPNRNHDGELTSNGPCRFHPSKRVMPQKSRADTGHKEPYHPCCNESIGSRGCTTHPHHVFKTSSPARMAAVLPFITTPENSSPESEPGSEKEAIGVTFDCEMGYTTMGLELIRLTAVAWPSGAELLDILVRPLGTVLDLNSQFSGVWPEHFANAVPYSPSPTPAQPTLDTDGSTPSTLPIVSNPQEARALLCTFLTPDTPLLGHGLENDLNTLRLCHPTIIDSIICFPHPRGMPMRFGLKMLTKRHLDRDIQTAGAQGHDSLEDARATGDLIRFRVKEEWQKLRAAGWTIREDELVPPDSAQLQQKSHVEEGTDDKAPNSEMMNKALSGYGSAGRKRRRSGGGSGGLEASSTTGMASVLKLLAQDGAKA
ncbi:hypothetical protein K431DRAFT_215100 [Polychaeton citri CBS 116435]|uniref:Exonuclease domain-containing protein n=1 Tax=Polychaeton citri CBS 116435 TaxID=1314669 RepID=A0A9P4QJ63_9PEZI|nr:hypothetical protein K431DRAFT_215100 [Polychaeton citri CBS 116435]